MEISVNIVLFEELKEKPDDGAEARIEILRESKDVDSAIENGNAGFDLAD